MAFDPYLQGLSPWDPKGSLSDADADRIWNSYKLAGGGRDVSHTLPGQGGGILGLLQGQSPQGIMGLLQRGMGGSPLAGNMPQAGMLTAQAGVPGSLYEGPVTPRGMPIERPISPVRPMVGPAPGGPATAPAPDVRDKYGEYRPFPGSIPTFPPGSSTPRYVMPDGTIRPPQ